MVVLKLRAGPSRILARRRRKLLVARSLEISCFVLRISLRHFVYFGFGIRMSNLVAGTLWQNSLSFATLLHRLGREFPALRPSVARIIDGFCN